jgi:dihydrofolate synthase/folylpolyglutamate synthase
MAFQHFAKCAVDVAVVEVGMGGRFDATNTVMPLVSVITNVALDHQAHLGRTVAEIAFEKAGIIKPGVPVVTGRLTADAATVIERVAEERGAPLTRLGTEVRGDGVSPADFTFIGRTWTIEHLSSPLQGRHQVENAVCALAALEYVSMLGVRVGEDAVRRGCAAVHWEGRLEVLEPHPLLIVDGAHNPAAADVVADFLRAFHAAHPSARILLVLSTMQDKDYEGVLARLAPLADELILTRAQIARAAAVGALHAARPADSPPTFIAEAVADALALAHAHAAPDDLIFVTGSLMLVGEVKALLRGCGLSPLRG